jgi:WD40 repeat protein
VISSLQWTADSKTLIGNFTEHPLVNGYYEWTGEMVRSWDAETGEPIQTFSIPTHQSIAVELAPSEILLGFGVAHGEGYVLIWNEEIDDTYAIPIMPDGQENSFEMTQESIFDFRLSPDERLLATSYRDRVVIWNFTTGVPLYTIQDTVDGICHVDWLLNTQTLVTLCEGGFSHFGMYLLQQRRDESVIRPYHSSKPYVPRSEAMDWHAGHVPSGRMMAYPP